MTGCRPTGRVDELVLSAQDRLAVLVSPLADDDTIAARMDDLADLLTTASMVGLDLDELSRDRGLDDVAALASALGRAEAALAEPASIGLASLALADVRTRPTPLPRRWRTASPALVSRVLEIRDPMLRPTDRLRWRTTVSGTVPDRTSERLSPQAVPGALWADWSIRLHPGTPVDPSSFRFVASAVLALPGRTEALHQLIDDHVAECLSAAKVSHVLQAVAGTAHGTVVLRALTQLSDGLRSYGCPIDYERRRSLAATAPAITERAWDRICAEAGVPTGSARKLSHARVWVWELMTGDLPQRAPAAYRPSGINWLTAYHNFCLRLPPTAADLLEAHTRSTLDSRGCADEPTTWSPPPAWVTGDELPMPAFDTVDLDRLSSLLNSSNSPTEIAQELNTSLEHVRHLVRHSAELVMPEPPRPGIQVRRKPARTVPPPDLTVDRLRHLAVSEQRTLRWIAEQFGVDRKHVVARMRREDIPVMPSGRPRIHDVSHAWLHTQYIDRGRTLPDIAAEIGSSPTTLANRAREYGIPLRRRGGASHAANLTAQAGLPEPLASALRGQRARQRVRRFQVYARYRSLNEAAGILDVSQATLTTQLAHLEARCGGELIIRSSRRQQAQQLTALGRDLLRQADRHLGPHPDAPGRIPTLLAAALQSFWWANRLRKFIVVARSDTIAVAARVLESDPSTLKRSIKRLEHAVGGPLLVGSGPTRRHRLTPRGRRLLGQAERWLEEARPIGDPLRVSEPSAEEGVKLTIDTGV
jgi:DNA-binding MarR family transcriptional regulator